MPVLTPKVQPPEMIPIVKKIFQTTAIDEQLQYLVWLLDCLSPVDIEQYLFVLATVLKDEPNTWQKVVAHLQKNTKPSTWQTSQVRLPEFIPK